MPEPTDSLPAEHPRSAFKRAEAAAAALRGVAWEQVGEDDLVATMVELERAQRLLDHAKVQIAARLKATDAAAGAGWATAGDFLTALSGGHKGAGNGIVRLADRLGDLARTQAAMATGELSRAQAEVIVRNVAKLPRVPDLRAAAEARLLEAAHDLDATDLQRSFGTVLAELDPDGTLLGSDRSLDYQERAAHSQRFLAFTPDSLGGVRIRGYATIEEVERVKAALIPLTAPDQSEPGSCGGSRGTPGVIGTRRPCADPACGHDGRDPREFGARLWDALVQACDHVQASAVVPRGHGVAPRLVVTVALDALRATTPGVVGASGMLPGGAAISATAVRRLACDAEVLPAVLGSQSQILDLGRSQRLVTPALWHALVLRDQHCAFPGCGRLPIACDAHHIVHWADGGTTALDNLVLLCRRHHTITHHTPWQVSLDPSTRRPVWSAPPPLAGVRVTRFAPRVA